MEEAYVREEKAVGQGNRRKGGSQTSCVGKRLADSMLRVARRSQTSGVGEMGIEVLPLAGRKVKVLCVRRKGIVTAAFAQWRVGFMYGDSRWV